MNNADFLAMLGGAGSASSISNSRESEGKPILEFKAGKLTTARQPNGKYLVSPDQRRGTISLSWHTAPSSTSTSASSTADANGMLKFEWIDRRTRTTVDSHTIFPEDNVTYSRVDTGHPKDRVYLLQFGTSTERIFFYWMQDKEEGNQDEDNCVKINTYVLDPNEAKCAANGDKSSTSSAEGERGRLVRLNLSGLEGGGLDNDAFMQIIQGANSTNDDSTGISRDEGNESSAVTTASVNPESTTTSTGNNSTSAANSTPSKQSQGKKNTSGGLTLCDLQGAMAALATKGSPAAKGSPLDQNVTPEPVLSSGILNDQAVKSRLISLLPENQRTEEHLMENLRSPQLVQCLESLVASVGKGDVLNSLLVNFQQSSSHDEVTEMVGVNPLHSFLECVSKTVEKRKEDESKEDDGDGDAEMSG